jgi:nucleotide-binding universal stress UspA family protein
MTAVVVPVRYPPNENSLRTLREAESIARDRGADLTVLHVDLYHESTDVSRHQLKRAVEDHIEDLENVRYVVRKGLLVEETILEEVVAEEAAVVVIGTARAGRWRQMVRRLLDNPDIEEFLQEGFDAEVVTVDTE